METIVYVDRSDISAGKADELEAAAHRLAEFVAAAKPRALSYGIYFSDDRSSMTVVHVHPDNRSLEDLMALIAPMLASFRGMLRLRSIDLYGTPSDTIQEQLDAKVKLLGGTVTIHRRVAAVGGR